MEDVQLCCLNATRPGGPRSWPQIPVFANQYIGTMPSESGPHSMGFVIIQSQKAKLFEKQLSGRPPCRSISSYSHCTLKGCILTCGTKRKLDPLKAGTSRCILLSLPLKVQCILGKENLYRSWKLRT